MKYILLIALIASPFVLSMEGEIEYRKSRHYRNSAFSSPRDLQESNFDSCAFSGNLLGNNFYECSFFESHFRNVKGESLNFSRINQKLSQPLQQHLLGSPITYSIQILNSEISASSFVSANLMKGQLMNTSFVNCDFTEANLTLVRLNGSKFKNCNFTNATFANAWSVTTNLPILEGCYIIEGDQRKAVDYAWLKAQGFETREPAMVLQKETCLLN